MEASSISLHIADMDWSYWEVNMAWNRSDLIILGSGIVGLNAAIRCKESNPHLDVMVLDRGMLPMGASTRNAGFACFGSMTELIEDVEQIGLDSMRELVERRFRGLRSLRDMQGDDALRFSQCGGYELFPKGHEAAYSQALEKLDEVNDALFPVFGEAVFLPDNEWDEVGVFNNLVGVISNPFEGSLHPGAMMDSLMKKARELGVQLRYGAQVERIDHSGSVWKLALAQGLVMTSERLILANNGWASQFIDVDTRTVRNQVLVTAPLEQPISPKVYHIDRGYVYLRTVDHHWSGILGVGRERIPLVKDMGNGLYIAVRAGGMGVAIGTDLGREVADMVLK